MTHRHSGYWWRSAIWLMLAATAGALPAAAWLYFALAQFPLYMSRHLLRPIARRKAGQLGSQH